MVLTQESRTQPSLEFTVRDRKVCVVVLDPKLKISASYYASRSSYEGHWFGYQIIYRKPAISNLSVKIRDSKNL